MGDMAIGALPAPSQVMVAVRLRPLLASYRPHEMICAQALPYTQQVVLGHNCYQFQLDSSFPMDATQSQVFDVAIAPLMDRLLQGYDTSVVVYGQSMSGKTYTLLGPGVYCNISETEYGIIPRAARYIFNKIKQGPPKKVKVKVSFVEVLNEKVRDLLVSNQYQHELTVLESDAGYPVITGLQEFVCDSINDVFSWLQMGMETRHLEWNGVQLSGHSTQSHCIFTLYLEQEWLTHDGTMEQRLSIARFTDLASSEKIFYRGMSGEIIGEPIHMDPGLIALNNVVHSMNLLSPWPTSGLPWDLYRQSTLTKILKESFGGRCFSLVMCCISPTSLNFDESLMTLRFAERVRNIKNYPVMNALSVKVRLDRIAQGGSKQGSHSVGITGEGGTADVFGLEFAASQWMKLVDSAEGLLNRLARNNTLTEKERDEIEKWLCLKHECEECVGSEGAGSVVGNEGRLLEKIDEVTETEEKTDSSKEAMYGTATREHNLPYESESESEIDSQRPGFIEKLVEYLKQLQSRTDEIVANQNDNIQEKYIEGKPEIKQESTDREVLGQHPVRSCFPSSARRKSIHPGTQLPFLALAHDHQIKLYGNSGQLSGNNEERDEKVEELPDKSFDDGTMSKLQTEEAKCISKQIKLEPQQELKNLSAGNEEKQNQMKKVLKELEGAYKRKEELQATIQIKEQFIQDMNNNADTRTNARQRFQQKRTKLEAEYHKTCAQLAQAKHALHQHQTTSPSEENTKLKKEVEKYKRKASKYSKRLKNVEIINLITGDSARKVLELEQSLKESKRQMEKLKQQLKREETRKRSLECELQRDQQKLIDLREKYDIQATQLEEKNGSEVGSKEESLRRIKEEEIRILKLRGSSQQFHELLLQNKSNLDKREALLKERACHERPRARNIIEKTGRLPHFDQVLRNKSTDVERLEEDDDEKEALRLEIRNLRSTRDCLLDNRCELDSKFQREKTLTMLEERKLLECDEAIEAIDTAIEFKNELICGRKGGLDATGREKGEEMLMARLNKLSPMEMRVLLYKYFQKVIDLRESGRKLEVQLMEKEQLADAQTCLIKELNNAQRQLKLENDRRIISLQWQHQEKLHLMLRTFAEESSAGEGASSGTETDGHHRHRTEKSDITTLKTDNRRLRQKLWELESYMQKIQCSRKSGYAVPHTPNAQKDPRSRSISPEPIPKENLKQLKAAASSPTTKVTRQKNKLIIQQQKPSTSRTKQLNS